MSKDIPIEIKSFYEDENIYGIVIGKKEIIGWKRIDSYTQYQVLIGFVSIFTGERNYFHKNESYIEEDMLRLIKLKAFL